MIFIDIMSWIKSQKGNLFNLITNLGLVRNELSYTFRRNSEDFKGTEFIGHIRERFIFFNFWVNSNKIYSALISCR